VNIKAFIFDMDGVITDTVPYHYESWKRLSEEENIPFTKEDNEQLLGRSRLDSLRIFLKGKKITPHREAEMLEKKNQYFHELIKNLNEQDLIPGIKDLLLAIRKLGLKLSVASSSKNAKFIISKLGIAHLFDCIIDGNLVTKAKPEPELFLKTADCIAVSPCNCIVVEDSAAGVEAALRANMKVIGIGPEERVGKATFRYNNIKEINLTEILHANQN